MAEMPGDVLRRAVDAYLQYSAAVGKATADYLESLRGLAQTIEIPTPLSGRTLTVGARPAGHSQTVASAHPAPAPAERSAPAVMVLEAASGKAAVGVFLVENLTSEQVSAPVTASAFAAPDGTEVTAELSFEPEIVTLDPGEQMLVRVGAMISEELQADVSYRGDLTVPGGVGTGIPIVLRRRGPTT